MAGREDEIEMAREPNYRKFLAEHTEIVMNFLALLDAEMKGPSTEQRGRRIAALSNQLEMSNDKVRYHVLGIDYRTDTKGRDERMG